MRDELGELLGERAAEGAARSLARAVEAYEADRYRDAATVLGPLAAKLPRSPTVRELYGLTLYRQGRWSAAVRQLEAYKDLTGSLDQHPVLADCHRAMGNRGAVEQLWEELREASPSSELVAEGRIVAAGARADAGDLDGAISLLRRARQPRGRPRTQDLRVWYALADLYERAGDLPRARELFARVVNSDEELSDAAGRLESLG